MKTQHLLPLLSIFFMIFFLDSSAYSQARLCAANEVMERQIANDPSFAARMIAIEKQTQEYVLQRKARAMEKKPDNPGNGNGNGNGGGNGGGGTTPPTYAAVTIPVIVHVLYNNNAENVSDGQISTQIDVLNKDFNANNPDYNNYVPSEYLSAKGNPSVNFCLVQTIRKYTPRSSFGVNDAMKFNSSDGSDAVNPGTHLNVWVCDLSGGYLGYAQFPGGSENTDGVVIDYQAFGTSGSAAAPFDKGRTGTHEVGHWLNLRHIWGDRRCGNDFVDDTPLHDGYNYGCPPMGARSTCKGRPTMMWMNYMDYTDDRCMYMFTNEQSYRMQATLISGGARYAYTQTLTSCPQQSSGRALPGSANSSETMEDEMLSPALFSVFPTVASSAFSLVATSAAAGVAELNIFSQTGVLVHKERIALTEGKNVRQLDAGNLGSGMYIVQLVQGKEIKTAKLMVQK